MKKIFCAILAVFALLTLVILPVCAEVAALFEPAEAGVTEAVEVTETAAPAATVDLTGVIVPAMELVFTFIMTLFVGCVAPKARKWLAAKTDSEQRKLLCEMTTHLVEAAEQMIAGPGKGREKLKYVMDRLEDAGLSADANLIEACVREMNERSLKELRGIFKGMSEETAGEPNDPAPSENGENDFTPLEDE